MFKKFLNLFSKSDQPEKTPDELKWGDLYPIYLISNDAFSVVYKESHKQCIANWHRLERRTKELFGSPHEFLKWNKYDCYFQLIDERITLVSEMSEGCLTWSRDAKEVVESYLESLSVLTNQGEKVKRDLNKEVDYFNEWFKTKEFETYKRIDYHLKTEKLDKKLSELKRWADQREPFLAFNFFEENEELIIEQKDFKEGDKVSKEGYIDTTSTNAYTIQVSRKKGVHDYLSCLNYVVENKDNEFLKSAVSYDDYIHDEYMLKEKITFYNDLYNTHEFDIYLTKGEKEKERQASFDEAVRLAEAELKKNIVKDGRSHKLKQSRGLKFCLYCGSESLDHNCDEYEKHNYILMKDENGEWEKVCSKCGRTALSVLPCN